MTEIQPDAGRNLCSELDDCMRLSKIVDILPCVFYAQIRQENSVRRVLVLIALGRELEGQDLKMSVLSGSVWLLNSVYAID